ncbi:hypothetical protein VIGAN_08145300, partial [Vigna angularis var. angularis]
RHQPIHHNATTCNPFVGEAIGGGGPSWKEGSASDFPFHVSQGGCHGGVATGGKFLSPLQQISNPGDDIFSPKISSNSPQSLSAAAPSPTLKFSVDPLTLEEDGGFALVQELESHLANM